jgi:hypothetical protein
VVVEVYRFYFIGGNFIYDIFISGRVNLSSFIDLYKYRQSMDFCIVVRQ